MREPTAGRVHGGVFVAAAALDRDGWRDALAPTRDAPHLLFDWRPGGPAEDVQPAAAILAAAVTGPVEAALCPHPGGPPSCWCRPPLAGLPLAFARAHGVDASRSTLVGTSAAHRTLAATLGARFTQI